MTADDLYEEMKEALSYLGLRFHDRHLVKVTIVDNKLVFTHRGKSISFDINNFDKDNHGN